MTASVDIPETRLKRQQLSPLSPHRVFHKLLSVRSHSQAGEVHGQELAQPVRLEPERSHECVDARQCGLPLFRSSTANRSSCRHHRRCFTATVTSSSSFSSSLISLLLLHIHLQLFPCSSSYHNVLCGVLAAHKLHHLHIVPGVL